MHRSWVIVTVLGVLLVAVFVLAIVKSTMSSFETLCEVCITFNGATNCREAWGPTREDAVRTAADNACAPLAGGMTESIRCSNTEPTRVTCQEGSDAP